MFAERLLAIAALPAIVSVFFANRAVLRTD
jgi:hypothetical protein